MTKYDKIMIAMFISRISIKTTEKSGILNKYRYNFEYCLEIGDIGV